MEIGNAVHIDLMHILPPVTAERYGGSHHPRCAECDAKPEVHRITYPHLEFI